MQTRFVDQGNSPAILCDGCGLPASPDHIRERVARLELATRYRPIHISVLFVGLAPAARLQDDFYQLPKTMAPETRDFFEALLQAVEVPSSAETDDDPAAARMAEFQRRGYYLTYVSECPLNSSPGGDDRLSAVSRLAPTLIKRIRYNYKPNNIAPLGSELFPLIEILNQPEVNSHLLLDQGVPLEVFDSGKSSLASREKFRAALAMEKPAKQAAKLT
jgi:hypothetical protein